MRIFEHAKQKAEKALESLKFPSFNFSDNDYSYSKLFGWGEESLRPLQIAARQTIDENSDPGLLIIESVMGDGKTEAAWMLAKYYAQKNCHSGLSFFLPTKSTASAIHQRVVEYIHNFGFDKEFIPNLVYGGAETFEAQDRSHAWYVSSGKKALLYPLGIGTIDQALKGVLNTKHHFVRMHALSNRVIIFDEIHACDVYMLTILCRLVDHLKQLNCTIIMLSATLP